MPTVVIDGSNHEAMSGERLIDLINRSGTELPQICYHPQFGPIQTCDTCIVEVDGKLTRAYGTSISGAINVVTKSAAADKARRAAFDRILGKYLRRAAAVWPWPRRFWSRLEEASVLVEKVPVTASNDAGWA